VVNSFLCPFLLLAQNRFQCILNCHELVHEWMDKKYVVCKTSHLPCDVFCMPVNFIKYILYVEHLLGDMRLEIKNKLRTGRMTQSVEHLPTY
jgi:hypothetical protein